MNSLNSQRRPVHFNEALAFIRSRGVRFWSENGQLHYRAPKGALTQHEIEILKSHKSEIAAYLQRSQDGRTADQTNLNDWRPNHFPFAYSQLALWRLNKLSERSSYRSVASATRLSGRLDIGLLHHNLVELLHRHDALRTRIVLVDGTPTQEILDSATCELAFDDLTFVQGHLHELESARIIKKHILEATDVGSDPPLAARLLKLDQDEHVLLVSMDHLISDGVSMNILLRELITAYTRESQGLAPSLPPVPVQFTDFSLWQRAKQNSWLAAHGKYWIDRMEGYRPAKFPPDINHHHTDRAGWAAVPIRIDSYLKEELLRWCRSRQTTLVMSIFSAYVGFLLRWCESSDIVAGYQTTGRDRADLEHTLGFLAAELFLRIEIDDEDRVIDLTNKVTNEYCKAHEHIDFSYLEAQTPPLEFTRGSVFNWLSVEAEGSVLSLEPSQGAIRARRFSFENPAIRLCDWDTDPSIVLAEEGNAIVGGAYFPLNRFSFETMETFGRAFVHYLRNFAREPECLLRNIPLS